MDKHKFSLNKKNNKTRPKTPLLCKRTASNKSNKSNISNINNNKPQRKSPKTIDYDKLMEKYGNMIDDNFDKYMHKKKNSARYDNNTMINKSPDRYHFNNKTEIANNPITTNILRRSILCTLAIVFSINSLFSIARVTLSALPS